jgi:multidrug efflux pump subunit AcrA (membrane-fusion protein)
VERKIELGLSDDKNVEVVSGLTADDRIITIGHKYSVPQGGKETTSPLMPSRPKRK